MTFSFNFLEETEAPIEDIVSLIECIGQSLNSIKILLIDASTDVKQAMHTVFNVGKSAENIFFVELKRNLTCAFMSDSRSIEDDVNISIRNAGPLRDCWLKVAGQI